MLMALVIGVRISVPPKLASNREILAIASF